ncbi:MAG TPA: ornithine carbamoyltransferase [Candidatus Paceibacterota bacterium]|nr:ornithine carbamoyltransferase [Candidatus Paceibacterota bacterium]
MVKKLKGRDFLAIGDLTAEELHFLLSTSIKLKKKGSSLALKGKTIALLFEKPSLRTRVSFDVAMQNLGGHSVYLSQAEVGLNKRESTADIACTLSRYVDGIVLRTFAQKTLIDLAEAADVPVINALSDEEHPCQALGDLLTIREHKGKIKGIRIAFVGDGHNVASSLAEGSVMCGADFAIASPREHQLPKSVVARIKASAGKSGGSFSAVDSIKEAVRNADVVYTDVWTSMGQTESESRKKEFAGYSVTKKLMSLAKPDAIFMHALPAHRGEEVEGDVIDGPQSVVFDQAENRLHAQRALLLLLLGHSAKSS